MKVLGKRVMQNYLLSGKMSVSFTGFFEEALLCHTEAGRAKPPSHATSVISEGNDQLPDEPYSSERHPSSFPPTGTAPHLQTQLQAPVTTL